MCEQFPYKKRIMFTTIALVQQEVVSPSILHQADEALVVGVFIIQK